MVRLGLLYVARMQTAESLHLLHTPVDVMDTMGLVYLSTWRQGEYYMCLYLMNCSPKAQAMFLVMICIESSNQWTH